MSGGNCPTAIFQGTIFSGGQFFGGTHFRGQFSGGNFPGGVFLDTATAESLLLKSAITFPEIFILKCVIYIKRATYSKCLNLSPCATRRNHMLKCNLIFLFCKFIIDYFYFRKCSTKGAALRKEPHRSSSYADIHSYFLSMDI